MKTKKRSIIILLLVVYGISFAAFEDMPSGARLHGFAGAAAAFYSYENLYYNPAGIWRASGMQIGVFTGKLFGLDELRHSSVTGVFHTRQVTFGLGAQTFGNNSYRESVVCAGICYKIDQSVYIGAATRYTSLSITGYGQAGSLVIDVGGIIAPSGLFQWGWAVRNAGYAEIGKCREKLPQSILSGVHILPVRSVQLNMDIYKDVRFPTEYRGGVEIQILPGFLVRSGIATEPSRFTAGFGLNWRLFSVDYAFNTHPYLKITHLFSIVFTPGK